MILGEKNAMVSSFFPEVYIIKSNKTLSVNKNVFCSQRKTYVI